MIQNRWRSKVLWLSILAQIIALLSALGFWQWIGVTEDWVDKVVISVMELLAVLGIVNNPTDPNAL